MRRFLVFLLAVPFLTGCGGVDGSLFATAVHNTEAAGGAEIAFQGTVEVPGQQPVVMTGTGVEDVGKQRAQITMQVPQLGEMKVVQDRLVMYMHFDLLTNEIGKEWMKLDLEKTFDQLGIDAPGLAQMGQGTSQQLRMLEKVSDGIKDEGREEIRGAETTHYSATVDIDIPDDDEVFDATDLTSHALQQDLN